MESKKSSSISILHLLYFSLVTNCTTAGRWDSPKRQLGALTCVPDGSLHTSGRQRPKEEAQLPLETSSAATPQIAIRFTNDNPRKSSQAATPGLRLADGYRCSCRLLSSSIGTLSFQAG